MPKRSKRDPVSDDESDEGELKEIMLKLHKATVDKRAKKRQKFVKDLQDYAHVAEKTIQSEIKAFEKDWNTALDQDKSYKKKIHRLGKILDHCWELHKTLFNDYSATITHSHDKATELLKNQKALLRLLETKSRLKKSSVAKLQASTKKSLEILEAYTTNMTTLQNSNLAGWIKASEEYLAV